MRQHISDINAFFIHAHTVDMSVILYLFMEGEPVALVRCECLHQGPYTHQALLSVPHCADVTQRMNGISFSCRFLCLELEISLKCAVYVESTTELHELYKN